MEIRAQVTGGGGEFTDLFNTRVSCLVCAKPGTPKYMASRGPVVVLYMLAQPPRLLPTVHAYIPHHPSLHPPIPQRAAELGIPVVSEEWLAQCLEQVGTARMRTPHITCMYPDALFLTPLTHSFQL